MKKWSALVWGSIIITVFILLSSPFWGWLMKPVTQLDILIIDKTVPDETYREHLGLTWFLNQQKIRKYNGQDYQLEEDYVGFVPKANKTFEVRPYPNNEQKHDIIYIADGYGVYEEDLLSGNEQGERSKLIYGGMTEEDVEYLRNAAFQKGTTLIAEFNTFGSPTSQEVRQSFYQLYNLEWTGWIGRYFDQLEGSEVPLWAKNNYEQQFGLNWDFSGEGMIFVDESDRVIVLTEKDMITNKVLFQYTEQGSSIFGLTESAPYHYWFDIIVPKNEEEVLATFSVSVTEEAGSILKENGIPTTFPAVIHHQNAAYDSYYFSGDFADQADLPAIYQTIGFTTFKKWQSKNRDDLESFYWRIYTPMMSEIIKKQTEKGIKVERELATYFNGSYSIPGKAGTDYLQMYRNGQWEDFLIKGVNMGIAKPGTWPGETGISKQEYFRWFQQIGEMNANAIRIYTIHPPHFYEALAEYNRTSEENIYLFHGVWLNEEIFLETHDAFAEENTNEFKEEIKKIIDLTHGNANIEERIGHASGMYMADVSPYVLGWVLGVEWDPHVVLATNEAYKGLEDFSGEYVYTKDAEPFEIWLAEMMEYTISYESEKYQWQRPISFTNWVTTDLLEHPAEPSEEEDLVSVDPNLIYAKDTFEPGMFASYHIYPYYPDFLNYEKRYIEYIDHRGQKNNYAGYLQHMKEVHRMPLLVAEFGIPSSRGNTHNNIYGWNQGGHTEQEQGRIVARLFEDIVEEKMAGGLIFAWHDEWFKRTWNTMDFDNPDQRPYWKNVQTNEQMFGLLTFEPGQSQKIVIDGKVDDWEAINKPPLYDSSSILKGLYVDHDEGFLYVRLDAVDMEQHEFYLLFNIIEDQGQSKIIENYSIQTEEIDFLLKVKDKQNANLLIDSYYDTYYYMYANVLNMIETVEYADKKDNGVYHPIRLTLNKELTITDKEGNTTSIPFESYETGVLRKGTSNPNDEDFDSLTDYYMNEENGVLEVRIPWALLNVKDPGHREVMGDVWGEEGLNASDWIDGVRIGAVAVSNDKIVDTLPKPVGNILRKEDYYLYEWELWETPTYHERLKKSYYILKDLFYNIAEKGES